jgi:uncharacterized protein (TIGR02145 family)
VYKLSFKVNPTYAVIETKSVCTVQLPFTWNDSVFTAAGTKTTTLHTVKGCDSVVTMTLIVEDYARETIYAGICQGETYHFDGKDLTTTGVYYDTVARGGSLCDSIAELHLTVKDTVKFSAKELTQSICFGNAITAVPMEYSYATLSVSPSLLTGLEMTTHGAGKDSIKGTPSAVGTYAYTITATSTTGCANKQAIFNLKVNPLYYYEEVDSTCEGTPYTWTGHSVTIPTTVGTHIVWDSLHTASGCDSVYKLTFKVNPSYTTTVDSTIYEIQLPFTWNDSVFTAAGSKTLPLKTAVGCDSSIVMHLIVIPASVITLDSSVCDNDLPVTWYDSTFTGAGTKTTTQIIGGHYYTIEMTLHVNPTYSIAETKDVCVSALPYLWNDSVFTAAGTKTTTLHTMNGCDSVVTMTLTVSDYEYVTINDSICAGDTLIFGGKALTTYGTYYDTVSRGVGFCDSITILNLTVNPVYNITENRNVCVGALPYLWNDSIFYAAGTKTTTLHTVYGCDSVVTMHLSISSEYLDTLPTQYICQGDSYMFNDTARTVEGFYVRVDTAKNGCDSITVLHLVVYNPMHTAVTVDTCDWYQWNGTTYTSTGDYTYTHTDVHGCTQVDTLHLTIYHATNVAITVNTCGSYNWNGTNYNTSGDYTYSHPDINGCTQVDTLHLTITDITVSVVSYKNETCGNDGIIKVSSTGAAPIEYSIDGVHFQSSDSFTGLIGGVYTITARDANSCVATTTATIAPMVIPTLTLTCPPDLYDTTDFGSCDKIILPAELGTPTATHSLGWPYSITNNAPTGNLYFEGDREITWIMTDSVCGYKDTCYQQVHLAFPTCPDAVDCEGNIYHSVRIGCECWTQRNLESQKYSDCIDIDEVYAYVNSDYPNVVENVERFGRLYSHRAVLRDTLDNGYGHIQGVCPAGWYIPTTDQYDELNSYGASAIKSPLYWIPTGGTNTTGFSALPAGFYNGPLHRYQGLMGEAYFWSTSGIGSGITVTGISILLDCERLFETDTNAGMGYSVRCIKEKN